MREEQLLGSCHHTALEDLLLWPLLASVRTLAIFMKEGRLLVSSTLLLKSTCTVLGGGFVEMPPSAIWSLDGLRLMPLTHVGLGPGPCRPSAAMAVLGLQLPSEGPAEAGDW